MKLARRRRCGTHEAAAGDTGTARFGRRRARDRSDGALLDLAAAPAVAAWPAELPAVEVALLDGCTSLGPGIVLHAGARLRWTRTVSASTDLLVVLPDTPERLAALRADHPAVGVVVVDRRGGSTPQAVARSLAAGADAYVISGDAQLILAHLDALIRRRLAGGPSRATFVVPSVPTPVEQPTAG